MNIYLATGATPDLRHRAEATVRAPDEDTARDIAEREFFVCSATITLIGTDFQVGDGATYCIGSDRYAATVIERSRTGHRIVIQFDTARRADDGGPYTEAQRYTYEPNPDGTILVATRRKDGRYREQGGTAPIVAGRHHHYDPHV